MSYYRSQLKQPQPLTACLAHLSPQVGHEVKRREGRKGRILRKGSSGACEGDGERSDLTNFHPDDPFFKQWGCNPFQVHIKNHFFVDRGVKININHHSKHTFVLGNGKPPTISGRQGWKTTRTAPQGSTLREEPHMFQELLKQLFWNTS